MVGYKKTLEGGKKPITLELHQRFGAFRAINLGITVFFYHSRDRHHSPSIFSNRLLNL